MGIFKAFKDSVASTFLDQWKEIITAGEFHEHSLVVPGVLKTRDKTVSTDLEQRVRDVLSLFTLFNFEFEVRNADENSA